jgi:hypothetical protein
VEADYCEYMILCYFVLLVGMTKCVVFFCFFVLFLNGFCVVPVYCGCRCRFLCSDAFDFSASFRSYLSTGDRDCKVSR